MHSTTLLIPFVLLATLSSAFPYALPSSPGAGAEQLLEEGLGNWRNRVLAAIARRMPGGANKVVANAPLVNRARAKFNPIIPKVGVYNPKHPKFSAVAGQEVVSSSSAVPATASAATSSPVASSSSPSAMQWSTSPTSSSSKSTAPSSSTSAIRSFSSKSPRIAIKSTTKKSATTSKAATTSKTTTTSGVATTTSSKVATTTSTSASATATVKYTGQGTYFFQNGNAGACGIYNADSVALVALDYRLYGDMGQASQYCGKSVTITNTANGKTVVAIVQDACPTCFSKYSLDLSTGAYDAIGDRDTGILPISWSWN